MNTYKPIPRLPAFEQYDKSLSAVKEQVDIMCRQHPLAAMQWLNEVQSMLNRMRDTLQSSQFDDTSQCRTDEFCDE